MTKQRSIKRVYHLADERNWTSIKTHGLLSAAQLLERDNLHHWIDKHRPENLQLSNNIIIRDHKPMPPSALARCLTLGMTPTDWYKLLNQKVFFWTDLDRLDRQRLACKSPQYIMTIDAEKLLEHYGSRASVTPFNTGNARRAAAKRGSASFVPYYRWLKTGWMVEAEMLGSKPRSLNHKPVELTIDGSVADIFDFVTDCHLYQ